MSKPYQIVTGSAFRQGDLFAWQNEAGKTRRGSASRDATGLGLARPVATRHGGRGGASPRWARQDTAGYAGHVTAPLGTTSRDETRRARRGGAWLPAARQGPANGQWQCKLPLPPSANGCFRELSPLRRAAIANAMRAKGQRGMPPMRCITKQYRQWRKIADVLICATRPRMFTAPVLVELAFTPPDRRRRDPDNHNKPVIDAIVRGRVLADDSGRHISEIRTRWLAASKADAGVLVTVSEIP
jgi:Holliday junction resolvase RusA-like endonuclease